VTVVRRALTEQDHNQIWLRWQQGWTLGRIGRSIGRHHGVVQQLVARTGGVRPPVRTRAADRLALVEREEISRGVAAGESARVIAGRLGRAPSTVTRELARNGGRREYRAQRAEAAAWQHAARPKPCRLALNPDLLEHVRTGLESQWSPEQIAGWLKVEFPDEPELWVSHETIYLSLFVQSKALLRKELTSQLRTKRVMRKAAAATPRGQGRGQIVDAIPISDRPAEVEDRAVPGHWEGDLLAGSGNTHIITLAERQTRFCQLIATPSKRTEDVITALIAHIQTLPEQLRLSLTWDRGLEMAEHKRFTIDTGVQVYFCDPKSPWQRGTNENLNGLLRQYFPKGTSLRPYSQHDLNEIAAKLNTRPRETLGFRTPARKFGELVALTP
jgi:IS30 family transposase